MPNKKSTRKKTKTDVEKGVKSKAAEPAPTEAQTLLPDYVPIDFSAPPQHMEVIHKKIRGVKKKLRKITEIEQAMAEGKKKKITKEQEDALANKIILERNLADFEEIRSSLENLDLSKDIRLLLSVFFAAASTSSDSLIGLSANLLPPSEPPAAYNPLKELQHACNVAEKFLQGKPVELFHDPPVTFEQLQAEVKDFLKQKEAEPTPAPVEEVEAPKEVVTPEPEESTSPEPEQNATDEVEEAPAEANDPTTSSTGADTAPQETEEPAVESTGDEANEKPCESSEKSPAPVNQKKNNNKKRGPRRGRGKPDAGTGDRDSPKAGRGKKSDRGDKQQGEKNERGETNERGEKTDRNRGGRGRGNRGRGRGTRGGKKHSARDSDGNVETNKASPQQTPPPPKVK